MTIQSGQGTKHWFSGLPFQTTTPKSGVTLGSQKYWFSGLPLSPYAPTGIATLTPSLVTDADVFYAPAVSLIIPPSFLLPSLYVDVDVFYAPLLSTYFNQASSSMLISFQHQLLLREQLHFNPASSRIMMSFHHQQLFVVHGHSNQVSSSMPMSSTHRLSLSGAAILQPSRVTDNEVFHAPNLAIDNRFIDVDIFYPFRSTAIVIPIWYRETDTIYSVSLVQRVTLNPPAFSAGLNVIWLCANYR